jgi:hypothetical protein
LTYSIFSGFSPMAGVFITAKRCLGAQHVVSVDPDGPSLFVQK